MGVDLSIDERRVMNVPLSADEVKYGGGPLSEEEREYMQPISMWELACNGFKPLSDIPIPTPAQRRKDYQEASDETNMAMILLAVNEIGQASMNDIYFETTLCTSTIVRLCKRLTDSGELRRIQGRPVRWELAE